MASFLKDPSARVDFAVDWSAWLDGDTIATAAAAIDTPPDGALVIDSESNTAVVHTIWLTGGTVGARYRVRSRITTVGGRTDDRTIVIDVRQR